MIKSIYPIPAFADNYIWAVTDSTSSNACVVDPGDPLPVIDYLKANGLNLSHILITHHHPDHTGGLARLIEEYSPVVYGPGSSNIKGISHIVSEGDAVELFGVTFHIMEVPGHTMDHIAYFGEPQSQDPVLFCGDTLFAAGCGRLFEGTPEIMHESLQKLANLAPSTRVFCTHEYTLANLAFARAAETGNAALQSRAAAEQEKRDRGIPTLPSSIALELATNPFLRCDSQEIRASVESLLGHTALSDVEVFSTLRRWKDNF